MTRTSEHVRACSGSLELWPCIVVFLFIFADFCLFRNSLGTFGLAVLACHLQGSQMNRDEEEKIQLTIRQMREEYKFTEPDAYCELLLQ